MNTTSTGLQTTSTTGDPFVALFESAKPALVRLEVQLCDGQAVGSGFQVADGVVVTAAHVVAGASTIYAHQGSLRLEGSTIGINEDVDLALVQFDSPFDSELQFSDDDPQVGEQVAALGFPLDLGLSMTVGRVSRINADFEDVAGGTFVQTDAALNPGNSGGPIVALDGRVVGVVVFKPTNTDGVAFGLSSVDALRYVERWIRSPRPPEEAPCIWEQDEPPIDDQAAYGPLTPYPPGLVSEAIPTSSGETILSFHWPSDQDDPGLGTVVVWSGAEQRWNVDYLSDFDPLWIGPTFIELSDATGDDELDVIVQGPISARQSWGMVFTSHGGSWHPTTFSCRLSCTSPNDSPWVPSLQIHERGLLSWKCTDIPCAPLQVSIWSYQPEVGTFLEIDTWIE